jgi:hypothetical protein
MSVEEDTAEDQDGDFDAQYLPVRWRGGETIRRAVREVRSDHAVEGEEGHVAAPLLQRRAVQQIRPSPSLDEVPVATRTQDYVRRRSRRGMRVTKFNNREDGYRHRVSEVRDI